MTYDQAILAAVRIGCETSPVIAAQIGVTPNAVTSNIFNLTRAGSLYRTPVIRDGVFRHFRYRLPTAPDVLAERAAQGRAHARLDACGARRHAEDGMMRAASVLRTAERLANLLVTAPANDEGADRWARVRMVAHAIGDADLDDEADVVRACFAARLSVRDFADLLDDAVAAARELRNEQ